MRIVHLFTILDSMFPRKMLTRNIKKGKLYQRVAREKLYRTYYNRLVRKDIFITLCKINLCDIPQNINTDTIRSV